MRGTFSTESIGSNAPVGGKKSHAPQPRRDAVRAHPAKTARTPAVSTDDWSSGGGDIRPVPAVVQKHGSRMPFWGLDLEGEAAARPGLSSPDFEQRACQVLTSSCSVRSVFDRYLTSS